MDEHRPNSLESLVGILVTAIIILPLIMALGVVLFGWL